MNVSELPTGKSAPPLSLPHFPAKWQAVLWRNWGLVCTERLAEVLQCSTDVLRKEAAALGLLPEPQVHSAWLSRGYLTLIRCNWHLLPYEQLLILLGWPPEKLAYTLKEEDFLWTKLGGFKPQCDAVSYQKLTPEQQAETAKICRIVRQYFPPEKMEYSDPPFAFASRFAPRPVIGKENAFHLNFIHAFSAGCGDILGNSGSLEQFPENLLAQYASMGIRDIWFHALLYLLCPIPGAEEFSAGHELRLENLKKIVARCAKYGIKVYLYLNEPRCMPEAFYRKKPEWAGFDLPAKHTKTICTTRSPEPLEWLKNAVNRLFTVAEGLGGIFCITMSENPTNCHCNCQENLCPTCRDVPPEKIIADIINAMEQGMHATAPDAAIIAYDWAWRYTWNDSPEKILQFKQHVMARIPENVRILSVSENGLVTRVGGVEQVLSDYSISQTGPAAAALDTWALAKKHGMDVLAKIQINNSWELSAVPYIPVPYLVQEHLQKLKNAGVTGLMLSWTLGGFPGGNIELLNASPEEIAAAKFQSETAEKICRAWKIFSESFRNFPFHINVIYKAPMNFGPMNLLHLKNTGFKASMVGFPYDDLEGWRGPYPEEIFENQFRILTDGWKNGLDILDALADKILPSEQENFCDLHTVAHAAYCHLRSTYLQIAFVRARNNGPEHNRMIRCIREEMETTLELYNIVRQDSRTGFEASNHYYYTLNDLREKIVSCTLLLERLSTGIHA